MNFLVMMIIVSLLNLIVLNELLCLFLAFLFFILFSLTIILFLHIKNNYMSILVVIKISLLKYLMLNIKMDNLIEVKY